MKIKICGINSKEAALAAHQNGADFLGLIFAENSPRKISAEAALEIARALPRSAKLVGFSKTKAWILFWKFQTS